MNLGIQDAHNLAWKLALVIQRRARPEILESYHIERHRLAKNILNMSDRQTRILMWRSTLGGMATRFLMKLLAVVGGLRRKALSRSLQLDTNYRKSPLSYDVRGPVPFTETIRRIGAWEASSVSLLPGDRAPNTLVSDCEPRVLWGSQVSPSFQLLIFDRLSSSDEDYSRFARLFDEIRNRWRVVVQVHLIVSGTEKPAVLGPSESVVLDLTGDLHRLYGAVRECVFVIRPDGYIGFRCQPLDGRALISYLREMLE